MIQNIYSYVCQQFEYLYTVIVWRHLKDTRNIFQNESEFFNYVLGFSNITGVCLQGTRAGIKIVILGLKLIWLQLKCVFFLTLKVSDESKKNLDFFLNEKVPNFSPLLRTLRACQSLNIHNSKLNLWINLLYKNQWIFLSRFYMKSPKLLFTLPTLLN